MALLRVSFLFFQQGYGWSNTWFLTSSASDPYADALTKALALAQKMQNICGNNTWINGWRVSDETIFRDVSLRYYGTGNVGLNGTLGQSAAPQNALIYKHNSTALTVPSAYRPFRGLPVSMMQQGGIWTPTVGWTAANNAYRNQLTVDGWGWLGATTRNTRRVSAVAASVTNIVTVTISAAMPGIVGGEVNKVSIARLRGASQINGLRQVEWLTPTSFKLFEPIPITPYISGGTVLLSVKGFTTDAGTGNWQRMAERKPGRPFYLSRGRRLVRRAA
jgi:hypothetical protein